MLLIEVDFIVCPIPAEILGDSEGCCSLGKGLLLVREEGDGFKKRGMCEEDPGEERFL